MYLVDIGKLLFYRKHYRYHKQFLFGLLKFNTDYMHCIAYISGIADPFSPTICNSSEFYLQNFSGEIEQNL